MADREIACEWFKNLIADEIKEELGTVANERIWANGADDGATASMHEDNAATHELYIDMMKEAYAEIVGEEYEG